MLRFKKIASRVKKKRPQRGPTSIRLTVKERRALKAQAAKENRSLSSLLRNIIPSYITYQRLKVD